jgi:hypothetical protein
VRCAGQPLSPRPGITSLTANALLAAHSLHGRSVVLFTDPCRSDFAGAKTAGYALLALALLAALVALVACSRWAPAWAKAQAQVRDRHGRRASYALDAAGRVLSVAVGATV